MTLVIMAAGMGSRFGGLKQIEPMGPNDEFLIDYSIYDCIKYGFDKVVFIIKEENYEVFKNTIGKRVDDKIKVEYVFQSSNYIPEGIVIPKDRVKPLGTAHAIYCCKDIVKDNFAIINADDFYGPDAFKKASEFLKIEQSSHNFGMVSYQIANTLTEHGKVKRGVCQVKDNYLTSITESSCSKLGNDVLCTPLNGEDEFTVPSDAPVSMNMFLFTPYIFELLKKDILEFFRASKDLTKEEYLIPDVVQKYMTKKDITVEVLKTTSTWYGVTYKEDTPYVRQSINNLVKEQVYPNKLW